MNQNQDDSHQAPAKFLDFDEYFMVRVNVSVSGSVVVVEFTHQEDRSVYEFLLENRMKEDFIRVRQKGLPILGEEEEEGVGEMLSVIFPFLFLLFLPL